MEPCEKQAGFHQPKNMPKEDMTLEEERAYYSKMARNQANLSYHKQMSKFYDSWRGTANKLPEAMKDTAKRILKKSK